jgi:hypothetical protein
MSKDKKEGFLESLKSNAEKKLGEDLDINWDEPTVLAENDCYTLTEDMVEGYVSISTNSESLRINNKSEMIAFLRIVEDIKKNKPFLK